MLADELDYVVGVDTHRDQHTLAVVAAPTGAVVAKTAVQASACGYAAALRFTDRHANGSVSILRTEGSTLRDAIGVPAWAPGGGRIVYSRAVRGAVHLWLQSVSPRFAAGFQGEPVELTSGPGRDTNPAWSPDGRWIAFEHASGGASDLLAIHPDGTGLHALSSWRGRESYPDYSPDGREIVFASDLTGRFQLYAMPAQGGLGRRITHDDGDDTHARWSPSGRWIAFSSNRDGDNDAYVVDPDGGHQRALTHNASEDVVEDWQAVRDARAPVVRALPSRATGSRPQVRFTVSDASARVLVSAEVELPDQTDDESYDLFVEPAYVDPRSAGVKTLRVVADETGPPPATQARFCVHAIDPWGNSSTQSCARLRLE
jgi:dipeptidyl aminopeptidase/acylaminoacyl peptidase